MSKNQIIKGTVILTVTGIITRFMGFFYRIYLSRIFGEEGIGMYQLIFPVFAFCYAVSSSGIETSLSRSVAHKKAKGKWNECQILLWIALVLSFSISFLLLLLIQKYNAYISTHILKESRCEDMLTIMSYSIPFASIHGCICGYYYGLKETAIPALSQLLEQITRIGFVFVISYYSSIHSQKPSILFTVAGLVLGEIIAALFSFQMLWNHQNTRSFQLKINLLKPCTLELLKTSIPLTANRMLLTALQSIESISIPSELQRYGHSPETALSIYGVLTGMALPCIFFPTAITNAAAVMLLPTVAEYHALEAHQKIKHLIIKTILLCIGMGITSLFMFLLFGNMIGDLFFKSSLASKFIFTLSFICPFLYANSTMISMINGLGKAIYTFFINMIGIMIRILCIKKFMLLIGISAYLYGLLLSQVIIFILCIFILFHSLPSSEKFPVT